MAVRQRIRSAALALLGISTYQADAPAAAVSSSADPSTVERLRRQYGGQLTSTPLTQTRWYLGDIETAEWSADNAGDLSMAAMLMNSARRDGVFAGILSTRCDGLVACPKRFRGRPEIVKELELGHDSIRSVFDEMYPPAELGLLAGDGINLGVGVGELLPVEGRDYPVFCRLDPAFLRYSWSFNRWFYRSIGGDVMITPGDGRWILHTPGGRVTPWRNGLWRAIARAYVRKEHAQLHRDNWEAKLANPARVAKAPQASSELARDNMLERLMAWGVNTVFALTPGWDIDIIESNGRGADSFVKTIAESNNEFTIAIAGQTVTVDGGVGFSNTDMFKAIRADLIHSTADNLAYTINTQGLPKWIIDRWGERALMQGGAQVEWDVTPPKDRSTEAQSLVTVATAITALSDALQRFDRDVDVAAVCASYGVPVKNDVDGDGVPDDGMDDVDPELEVDDEDEDTTPAEPDNVIPLRRSEEAA